MVFRWYYKTGNNIVDEEALVYVETNDGMLKIYYRGHYYNRHKIVRDAPIGTVRWQCEDYGVPQRCRGYIHVLNGRVTRVSENGHNHGPNPARLHHLQVGIFKC